MSDYCLTCCSTVDLTPEQLSRNGIRFACCYFELDGEQYDDDMGKSISCSGHAPLISLFTTDA